jgi:hypothetical protein
MDSARREQRAPGVLIVIGRREGRGEFWGFRRAECPMISACAGIDSLTGVMERDCVNQRMQTRD